MNAYERLMAASKEARLAETSAAILNWDLETYMPPKGIRLRSEQLGYLSTVAHLAIARPEFGQLIEEAEKLELDEVQRRNLYLFKREYAEKTSLPAELVGEHAKQQAVATETWRRAKAAKDWSIFQPELQKMVDLSVRRAELLMEPRGVKTVYDSMLDEYERGMRADAVARVFSELRTGLIPLVSKYADASSKLDLGFINRRVPVETQRRMALGLASFIQYDVKSSQAGGRIDEAEHPFTTGYFDDVRFTVHYHEDNVSSAIYAVLHEGGHALYEQNLCHDWMYTPVGQAASSGIHESMSRFVENIVGRSPEFWRYYYPHFCVTTDGFFSDISPELMVLASNIVRPSKIRVEADELTYSLHIIIRFEIERDLFSGKISVSELPQAWNDKYEHYLGVEIENDSEGVMQDIHWSAGLFGYFPSYALGNVYDGMWLQKLDRDLPDWRASIEQGSFAPVKEWLIQNVHRWASMYDPADLLKRTTGKSLTAKPFLAYLKDKYSAIFGV
ncbi:MAG: carboxypeptidase M32 [Candidatus Thorarchaeota archaeon]|nr:carboxypeptidase M32 [Candidatus Thorarchaeota archaeon]